MAPREIPTSLDADNSSGSSTLAACSDWRSGAADSMSARTIKESTSDAGYTTAGCSLMPSLSISPLYFGGSPYTASYKHSWALPSICLTSPEFLTQLKFFNERPSKHHDSRKNTTGCPCPFGAQEAVAIIVSRQNIFTRSPRRSMQKPNDKPESERLKKQPKQRKPNMRRGFEPAASRQCSYVQHQCEKANH